MSDAPELEALALHEFESLAKNRLPQSAYDYFAGGAGDELTVRENRAAFERLHLVQRVLRDVGKRALATTVLGRPLAMPVMVAPTAFHCLACPEGELATARAAAAAGVPFVVSTLATVPLEQLAKVPGASLWFQLYVYKDRGLTRSLVQRAEAAGYRALCLTVDAPYLGRRERDLRNRFALPPGLSIANLKEHMELTRLAGEPQSALNDYFARLLDPSITWKDVDWLQSVTSLPVVLKGVQHPQDARMAVDHGVKGVIVSNHGGRQLDAAPATIDLLPGVVEAVQGRVEVLLDGGVRRGTDVVKALALGSRAVLVGRPVLWGLAVAGERGVTRVLRLLEAELDLALALCGATSVADLKPDLVFAPGRRP